MARMKTSIRRGHRLLLAAALGSLPALLVAGDYYVDGNNGGDENPGSLAAPFKTIGKALEVTAARCERGARGDRVFIRAGRYREHGLKVCMRGVGPGQPALISAMPAKPGAPGAVQRKSGNWYERVIIDRSLRVENWTRTKANPSIWQAKANFLACKWWELYMQWYGYTDRRFPINQYCVLQDGKALLWANRLSAAGRRLGSVDKYDRKADTLMREGYRAYDVETDTLYLWPLGNIDPNTSVIEANGGTRHSVVFKVREMDHVTVRGLELRLGENLISSRETKKMWNAVWEDNDVYYFFRGWMCDAHQSLESCRNVTVRNNRVYRNAGEIWQLLGEGHVVEGNAFIERAHACWGPRPWVSQLNLRHSLATTVRNNIIIGQCADNPHNPQGGYVFTFESTPPYAKRSGPVPRGAEHVIENNLFVNNNGARGAGVIELGKGTRPFERTVLIRNNVFMNNRNKDTINISCSHKELAIENNIFYGEQYAIGHRNWGGRKDYLGKSPSLVRIRGNIFYECKDTIHPAVVKPSKGSRTEIENNCFYKCGPFGTGVIEADPQFRDAAGYDFRLRSTSPLRTARQDIGIYARRAAIPAEMQWWGYFGKLAVPDNLIALQQ